jgi:antagonist of KipI
MSLRVLKSGLLDTVQDLGRFGYAALGVHRAGAADGLAAQIANILTGNLPGAAVLEMHFPAPILQFEQDTLFALGGGDFDARLDGTPIPCWTPVRVAAGGKLVFKNRLQGLRCYLAIRGGLQTNPWLGARSTSLVAGAGGWQGRALRADDRLPLVPACDFEARKNEILPWRVQIQGAYPAEPVLRYLPGREYEWLDEAAQQQLESADWRVGPQSNRMACALQGPALQRVTPFELVSSAVQPGLVQLLPGGDLLALMADCQTTGGYPRIAQIVEADLPALAQMLPGTPFRLARVSLEAASAAAQAQRAWLRRLRRACAYRLEAAKITPIFAG